MSNPAAGWYPDPGGQPGMFRYWDGSAWSAALSPTPQAAPPSQGLVPRATTPGTQPLGRLGQQGPAGGGPGGHGHAGYASYGQHHPVPPARTRSSKGWIAVLAVVGVVVAVLIGLAVRAVSDVAGGGSGQRPNGQPTQQVCPEEQPATAEPTPPPADGRVHGGALSFPMLPPPWEAPHPDNRVPFGRDVQVQTAFVEDFESEGSSWVASVLVGELIAGDGFFTPEQGAEIVVRCVVGVFYGPNTEVTRDDRVSRATTVDGKDAWLVESHLTFDIPDLETKGETLILMIVATGEATASLFYASIPDTSPQFMQPARDAMENLRVEE
ncbi:DUF2510 domain-containing protein [Auraticoccus cholistanensis]|uniref:DUF2510 domain-containing protein n=1 Tax=Auraticoccus cholistanensis TaxID=2656650 RepID=UPI0018D23A25